MLELDLIVAFELLLRVTSLQVQLKLKVASIRLNNLLLLVLLSLRLGSFELG